MKYEWKDFGFNIPQIMIPREGTDYAKWAVVACDQFTSQPEYWKETEAIVGDAPSTLNLMLPELYLGSDNFIWEPMRSLLRSKRSAMR